MVTYGSLGAQHFLADGARSLVAAFARFVAAGNDLTVISTIAGVAGSFVALGALALAVSTANRNRRREYDSEIRAAEERGRAAILDDLAQARADAQSAREDARYWRSVVIGGRPTRGQRRDDDDAE